MFVLAVTFTTGICSLQISPSSTIQRASFTGSNSVANEAMPDYSEAHQACHGDPAYRLEIA